MQSIGQSNLDVIWLFQPRQDFVIPGFLMLMCWCALVVLLPFSSGGRYLCGMSVMMLSLMFFVSDCLALSATDWTCHKSCKQSRLYRTFSSHHMYHFSNNLRGIGGFEAVLEKWKDADYLVKVVSVDFSLDRRAVREKG